MLTQNRHCDPTSTDQKASGLGVHRDTLEAALAEQKAAQEGATSQPAATEAEESGLSGGAIAGIIAGGVVVAGGIAYAAMQAQGGRRERLGGAPQYSAVRRSERFSTMNF